LALLATLAVQKRTLQSSWSHPQDDCKVRKTAKNAKEEEIDKRGEPRRHGVHNVEFPLFPSCFRRARSVVVVHFYLPQCLG